MTDDEARDPCFKGCQRCEKALRLLGVNSYNNWRSFQQPGEHRDHPENAALRANPLEQFTSDELRAELLRRSATEEELDEEQFMARVNGVPFRCECGCNVFRKPKNDPMVYVCNSCSARWRGEK